jgi:hypothetical protein
VGRNYFIGSLPAADGGGGVCTGSSAGSAA